MAQVKIYGFGLGIWGFRVWGLGFWGWDLGFGLLFRVWGSLGVGKEGLIAWDPGRGIEDSGLNPCNSSYTPYCRYKPDTLLWRRTPLKELMLL